MRGRPRAALRGPARGHQLAVPATAYMATPTAALISARGLSMRIYTRITCTAAPRVWHFSAFHLVSGHLLCYCEPAFPGTCIGYIESSYSDILSCRRGITHMSQSNTAFFKVVGIMHKLCISLSERQTQCTLYSNKEHTYLEIAAKG